MLCVCSRKHWKQQIDKVVDHWLTSFSSPSIYIPGYTYTARNYLQQPSFSFLNRNVPNRWGGVGGRLAVAGAGAGGVAGVAIGQEAQRFADAGPAVGVDRQQDGSRHRYGERVRHRARKVPHAHRHRHVDGHLRQRRTIRQNRSKRKWLRKRRKITPTVTRFTGENRNDE